MTDRQTVYAVAAHTGCDPRTVRKFLDTRERVVPVADYACRRACAELGIVLPPARKLPTTTPVQRIRGNK
jgi:hypothetical protein